MKYVYGSLLFISVDLIILYSRIAQLSLSAYDVCLLGVANAILWIYFEKFWKTYENCRKELDIEIE